VLRKQSADVIGGPIMIADLAGKVAQLGFDKLLMVTAWAWLRLGFSICFRFRYSMAGTFCSVEAVQGRALSERALDVSFRIGLAIVSMLIIFAFGNDLVRLAHSLFS
jgi:regulator of sigma E protease